MAEALDRISHDQEDIAGIYKRMRYADVKMFTLSEGEISELHIGLSPAARASSGSKPMMARPAKKSRKVSRLRDTF